MKAIRIVIGLGSALLLVSGTEAFAQKRQRDVITREEIQGSAARSGDLHRAIRSLRPHFLETGRGVRTLGNSIIEPLSVYVDGARQTGAEALRTLPADAVEEVRYLDPTKAGNELGPRASGGALLVKLHKARTDAPPPVPPVPPPPPLPLG